MKNIKSEIGILVIDSYEIPDKYKCVRKATIEEKSDYIEIVTYDQKATVEGKTYTPVVYQSCMHPEQITLYPLIVRLENGEVKISDHYDTGCWKVGDDIEMSDWRPQTGRRGCFPCTNCGRC